MPGMMRYLFQTFLIVIIISSIPSLSFSYNIKLLYFYENGCRWCAKMDEVLKDASIKRILNKNTDITRIDVKGEKKTFAGISERELTKRYNVKGVPTLIFFNSMRKEILRIPGVLTKPDFKDILCKYVDGLKAGCIAR
ncbi:MAG TPA: hypothetical protein ENG86_10530 [Nitrospirae bacterium]|nr:hypothetical protein [Nitrospirota bacterium]